MKKGKKHVIVILLLIVSSLTLVREVNSGTEPIDNKAKWIETVFNTLCTGKYDKIKAISYWHENWRDGYGPKSELRIDSSPESLEAYRNGIQKCSWETKPVFNASSGKLLSPEEGKMYHSAFPDFGETEDQVSVSQVNSFEDLVGMKIVWAYFSNNWEDNIVFPREAVLSLNRSGHVPFIRLMPWSDEELYTPENNYTLQRIIEGEFDDALTRWALDLKKAGVPVLIEFGVEINIDAFPWNGKYNGGGETKGYGDPAYPDGPERFRDSYIHIIELFRSLNVSKVTWFFHIDVDDEPEEWWNNPSYYYPGDNYIDWIGASVYGPQRWDEQWEEYSFPERLEKAYNAMLNLSRSKPLAILEFGADENADKTTFVYLTYYVLPSVLSVGFLVILVLLLKKIRKKPLTQFNSGI